VPTISNPFANLDLRRLATLLALTVGAGAVGFFIGHWIGTY
jgi:hypothetical protein